MEKVTEEMKASIVQVASNQFCIESSDEKTSVLHCLFW